MTGNHTTADRSSGNELYNIGSERAIGHSAESISTSVIIAVADELEVGPLELGVRLNDVVDPDALDALVASMNDGFVEFSIADCNVRVQATGEVFVGSD